MEELPKKAGRLLVQLEAPERLCKHLELVHDTAYKLLNATIKEWPNLTLHTPEVLMGAALHDIGKAVKQSELYKGGQEHLEAGHKLLLREGFPEPVAQIALLHENRNYRMQSLELLLVSLADVLWCGIRNNELEEEIIKRISNQTQNDYWQVFTVADNLFSTIATGADERLLYQNS